MIQHGIMKDLFDAGLCGRLPMLIQALFRTDISSQIRFPHVLCLQTGDGRPTGQHPICHSFHSKLTL